MKYLKTYKIFENNKNNHKSVVEYPNIDFYIIETTDDIDDHIEELKEQIDILKEYFMFDDAKGFYCMSEIDLSCTGPVNFTVKGEWGDEVMPTKIKSDMFEFEINFWPWDGQCSLSMYEYRNEFIKLTKTLDYQKYLLYTGQINKLMKIDKLYPEIKSELVIVKKLDEWS